MMNTKKTNIYIDFVFQSIKLHNFVLVRRQDEGAIRFRKKERMGQYGLNLFQDWHSYFFLATEFLPDYYSNEINYENSVRVWNA